MMDSETIFEHEIKEYLKHGWKVKTKNEKETRITKKNTDVYDFIVRIEEEYKKELPDAVWISACDIQREEYEDIHKLFFEIEENFFLIEAQVNLLEELEISMEFSMECLNKDFRNVLHEADEIKIILKDKKNIKKTKEISNWFIEKLKELKPYRFIGILGTFEIEFDTIIESFIEE